MGRMPYEVEFFPVTSCFSLRWQGNWIHRGEKRPANPVTGFPVDEVPRSGKRGYEGQRSKDTLCWCDRQTAAFLPTGMGYVSYAPRTEILRFVETLQRVSKSVEVGS